MMHFNFTDIPVLTSDSYEGVVKGGSQTTLTCTSASASSSTSIMWFRNNQTISPAFDDGYELSRDMKTLTIPSFRNNLNHNGRYDCMVNNLRSNRIELQRASK